MILPGFDLRAVILLAGALGALMGLVLYFLRRSYPPTIRGLGLWAAGPLLAFIATLFFGGRGVLPDALSIVFANFLLLLGLTLIYQGSRYFHGQPPSWRPWLATMAATLLAIAWFTHGQPSYHARLALVTAYLASLFLIHAHLLTRHGRPGFAMRFTRTVLLLESLILVLRSVSSFTEEGRGLLDATPMQTVYIAAYSVILVMMLVGLILMASDRLREEVEHLATHDSLTGTLNRRAFIETCEGELERCRRHHRTMALLMLDLDHFKRINDVHGHLAGDQVLLEFVARVRAQLRKPDHFGRYGGEEFVVLLPDTGGGEAAVVAERIRAAVARPGDAPDSLPAACTVSIGLAASGAGDETVDHLLARADRALYAAKAAGRNRVERD